MPAQAVPTARFQSKSGLSGATGGCYNFASWQGGNLRLFVGSGAARAQLLGRQSSPGLSRGSDPGCHGGAGRSRLPGAGRVSGRSGSDRWRGRGFGKSDFGLVVDERTCVLRRSRFSATDHRNRVEVVCGVFNAVFGVCTVWVAAATATGGAGRNHGLLVPGLQIKSIGVL